VRATGSAGIDTIFGADSGSPDVVAATDDRAWLTAMLDVERALAEAAASVGLVDGGSASAVALACDPARFDVAALAEGRQRDATPVIALVRRLRELVPERARAAVHVAVTSQDVVDTAMMLIARRALTPVLDDASATAELLAGLVVDHRDTVQLGRTLLQHATVTTFGAVCAARLVAVDDAAVRLADTAAGLLAVQLGGATGTLAPAGPLGVRLVAEVAVRLDLAEPVTPWHTTRGRVGRLAGDLGVLAGELAGVAQDVVLLSGSDVGEVSVAAPGGSSAMPHKRNPSRAVLAAAAAHGVPGLVATALAGMPQELQRAAGRWQAEPAMMTGLLRAVGATARHTRGTLEGLVVHPDVMRAAVTAFVADSHGVLDTGSAGAFADRALTAHAGARAARSRLR
jgi:3-carboxy-cis,cis-muconate cycloisomerase